MSFQAECFLQADLGRVRSATKWLQEQCESQNIPLPVFNRLDICLNETLANVITHGGDSVTKQPITLRFEVEQAPEGVDVSVTVADYGLPFNPAAFVSRTAPASLAEAEPGGLGLVMIHSNADRMSYAQIQGRNEFKFTVCELQDA